METELKHDVRALLETHAVSVPKAIQRYVRHVFVLVSCTGGNRAADHLPWVSQWTHAQTRAHTNTHTHTHTRAQAHTITTSTFPDHRCIKRVVIPDIAPPVNLAETLATIFSCSQVRCGVVWEGDDSGGSVR